MVVCTPGPGMYNNCTFISNACRQILIKSGIYNDNYKIIFHRHRPLSHLLHINNFEANQTAKIRAANVQNFMQLNLRQAGILICYILPAKNRIWWLF